jgi:hypothetical protein
MDAGLYYQEVGTILHCQGFFLPVQTAGRHVCRVQEAVGCQRQHAPAQRTMPNFNETKFYQARPNGNNLKENLGVKNSKMSNRETKCITYVVRQYYPHPGLSH